VTDPDFRQEVKSVTMWQQEREPFQDIGLNRKRKGPSPAKPQAKRSASVSRAKSNDQAAPSNATQPTATSAPTGPPPVGLLTLLTSKTALQGSKNVVRANKGYQKWEAGLHRSGNEFAIMLKIDTTLTSINWSYNSSICMKLSVHECFYLSNSP
jgi:hypothetical protein